MALLMKHTFLNLCTFIKSIFFSFSFFLFKKRRILFSVSTESNAILQIHFILLQEISNCTAMLNLCTFITKRFSKVTKFVHLFPLHIISLLELDSLTIIE
jgi:hypothetical protein